MQLNWLKNQEQNKPRSSREGEIIKSRTKTNEIEMEKTQTMNRELLH